VAFVDGGGQACGCKDQPVGDVEHPPGATALFGFDPVARRREVALEEAVGLAVAVELVEVEDLGDADTPPEAEGGAREVALLGLEVGEEKPALGVGDGDGVLLVLGGLGGGGQI